MADNLDLGSVYFKIDADTGKVTVASKAMDDMAESADRAEGQTKKLDGTTSKTNATVGKLGKEVEKTDKNISSFAKSATAAAVALAGMVASSAGLSKLVETGRSMGVINASLITATGSAQGAKTAFDDLVVLATRLPNSLDDTISAFIKLKNLGLDPSEKSIISYTNTASAMGKSLNQMIEAVADASTAEFERLKEFGIRAKNQGDEIDFTFRGVTTTVKNNSEEIQGYLLKLGEVDFAGAADERMKTLDGALSNLGDTWDGLFRTIFDSDVGGLIEGGVKTASSAISALDEMIKNNGDTIKATSIVIGTATGAYAAYRLALVAATIKQYAFNIALTANPIGATVMALGLLTGGLLAYNSYADDAAEKTKALTQANKDLKKSYDNLLTYNNNPFVGLDEKTLTDRYAKLSQIQNDTQRALSELPKDQPIKTIEMEILEDRLKSVKGEITLVGEALDKVFAKQASSATDNGMPIKESDWLVIPQVAPVQDVGTITPITEETEAYNEKLKELLETYQTTVTPLEQLKKDQAALNDLMKTASAEDVPKLTAALAEVDKQIEALATDEIDWEGIGVSAAGSITSALISGDWDGVGNSIGSSLGGAIGASLGSPIAGAVFGAIGGSLFGSKKQTGSSTTVGLSGGIASGFNTATFEKGGLFGGSSSTVEALGISEIAKLNNSLNYSFNIVDSSLSKLTGGIVVGFDDFSDSVEVSEGNLTGAISELTDSYVDANVSYIEDLQRTNETAVEALQRLSRDLASVQGSFEIVQGDALENAAKDYVSGQADVIASAYQDQLKTLESTKAQAVIDRSLAAQIYNSAYQGDNEAERKQAASMALEAAGLRSLSAYDDIISSATDQIAEISSRIPQAMALATQQFTDGVLGTIASLEGINQDEASDVFAQLANNYEESYYSSLEQVARAQDRAIEELEQFSDLGINANTSMDQFRKSFEAFIDSDAFTPEGYARWLLAADALDEYNDLLVGNNEILSEQVNAVQKYSESITDFTKSLLGDSEEVTAGAYRAELASALEGDRDALDSITETAQTYLDSRLKTASSAEQYAAIERSVLADMNALQDKLNTVLVEDEDETNRILFDQLAALLNISDGIDAMTGGGYASGGYTGDGGVNQIAGVVHKGEYVLSQDMLKNMPVMASAPTSMGANDASVSIMRAMYGQMQSMNSQITALKEDSRHIGLLIQNNTRDAADVLESFNIVGLPPERTA